MFFYENKFMKEEILLNNEVYHFMESELPCLIAYQAGTGGSYFSIAMVADLFFSGSKILFLTAYPIAKDAFLEQIKESGSKINYVTHEGELDDNAQVIIIESGNEELFLKIIGKVTDLEERVVLVKNMEVFSEKTFDVCLRLQKIIFSGEIDKCPSYIQKQISNKKFNTTIAFFEPQIPLNFKVPTLEKYTGYLLSQSQKGFVKVDK